MRDLRVIFFRRRKFVNKPFYIIFWLSIVVLGFFAVYDHQCKNMRQLGKENAFMEVLSLADNNCVKSAGSFPSQCLGERFVSELSVNKSQRYSSQ